MPIYEYKCASCAKVSEFMMKMSDPHPATCPKCQKGPLEKILSETSFLLKGGGWYNEGYAKKSGGESKGTESKGSESKASEGTSTPASSSGGTKSSD